MKIAYVTDSGTGKSIEEFKKDDIFSLPLQISYDETNMQDIEECSITKVLDLLHEKKVLQTSLPSLGKIEELFDLLKKEGYQRIIAVPICSGLSGTINALNLAANTINVPITCIDTYVTAVIQEYLIRFYKRKMEDNIEESLILKDIDKMIESCNTLLIPDDIHHLKRGGRLTPLAATLAGLLKIKPILAINKKTNGKIDVIDKVRTFSKALDRAIEVMKADGIDDQYHITIAQVNALESASFLKEKIRNVYPNNTIEIIPLCNPVAVHTGLGCLAIQYFKPKK